jgi:hypothetical protein
MTKRSKKDQIQKDSEEQKIAEFEPTDLSSASKINQATATI